MLDIIMPTLLGYMSACVKMYNIFHSLNYGVSPSPFPITLRMNFFPAIKIKSLSHVFASK